MRSLVVAVDSGGLWQASCQKDGGHGRGIWELCNWASAEVGFESLLYIQKISPARGGNSEFG